MLAIAITVIKKLKCDNCKKNITLDKSLTFEDSSYDWIKAFNRGLSYPHPSILNIIVYNYIVMLKLVEKRYEEMFLKSLNHRAVALQTTLQVLQQNEIYLETDKYSNGHSKKDILNYLILSSINTFLNNYCKKINVAHTSKKNIAKGRKLKTLKN